MELYGSPTTKELKKKHSPRRAGGAEMGSWAESTHGKAAAGGPVSLTHICTQLKWEEQLGSETDRPTQGPSTGK